MAAPKLNLYQRQILERMAREPGEGYLTAQWISEGCGRAYDTPWASTRLKALVARGFVSIPSRGWYVITDAGRQAIRKAEGL